MQLKNRGFSLVELMVAMVAGLLLVAAVSALFASVVRANKTALQVSRLNQEVQAITDMMARDIQRAGYDNASASAGFLTGTAYPSPFKFDSVADLMSETATGSGLYRCIRLRYDNDSDGCVDKNSLLCGSNSEDIEETIIYSFSSADQGVKRDPGNSASCNAGEPLSTDNTIEITNLTFSLMAGSVSSGARTIRIAIDGRDKSSPSLTLSLQRDIKLRNDGY